MEIKEKGSKKAKKKKKRVWDAASVCEVHCLKCFKPVRIQPQRSPSSKQEEAGPAAKNRKLLQAC